MGCVVIDVASDSVWKSVGSLDQEGPKQWDLRLVLRYWERGYDGRGAEGRYVEGRGVKGGFEGTG